MNEPADSFRRIEQLPSAWDVIARAIAGRRLAPLAWLGASLALALAGQHYLWYRRAYVWDGLFLFALAASALAMALRRGAEAAEEAVGPPTPAREAAPPTTWSSAIETFDAWLRERWRWLAGGALLSALAYVGSSGNRFTPLGVALWVASVIVWIIALADRTALPRLPIQAVRRGIAEPVWRVTISRSLIVFALAMLPAAFFRFYRLDGYSPEMTSDHAEKLLDVYDVVSGQTPIFFPRNTGREPMQFYFAAALVRYAGTGYSHLTLKITSAVAGFLTVPFIFLLAREVGDEALAVLAAVLAGISVWPAIISREGLRFPFTPLFAAPALFFAMRGLRRRVRNDFLWSGLCLGLGLYTYVASRLVPLAVVLAMVLWYWLEERESLGRVRLLTNALAMLLVMLAVFVPLLRFAVENPEMFWYRAISRLEGPQASPLDRLPVLLSNLWNSARMFNWRGDVAWVNAIPTMPALDWISGGLYGLGVVYVIYRIARYRRAADLLTLLGVPVLLLPSTLSLAFPIENPSNTRSGAAMILVFVVAAWPLRLLIGRLARDLGRGRGLAAGWAVALALLAWSAAVNYNLYFQVYTDQFRLSAQNASEVGAVIKAFARSIGSLDTAWVKAYPHWVDTRLVGMYAGDVTWNRASMEDADLARLQDDPRPKLYIVNPRDGEAVAELRRLYPDGRLSYYTSETPNHDFLLFFVPGSPD